MTVAVWTFSIEGEASGKEVVGRSGKIVLRVATPSEKRSRMQLFSNQIHYMEEYPL